MEVDFHNSYSYLHHYGLLLDKHPHQRRHRKTAAQIWPRARRRNTANRMSPQARFKTCRNACSQPGVRIPYGSLWRAIDFRPTRPLPRGTCRTRRKGRRPHRRTRNRRHGNGLEGRECGGRGARCRRGRRAALQFFVARQS